MMARFTFKKTVHEGRYRSFQKNHTEIKLNKKEVGYISEIEYSDYRVFFAVKKERTEKDPAGFMWIKVKWHFYDENDAREYIKDNNNHIQEKFDLYYFDD
jgi:hypothetical protein